MKRLLITVDGTQEIVILPVGSRISERGSGSTVHLNRNGSHEEIVVSDSISDLFDQLCGNVIKITVDGDVVVLYLYAMSRIKPNGSGSIVLFGGQKFVATESVSTLSTQMDCASGGGSGISELSFNTAAGDQSYTSGDVGVDLSGKTILWMKLNQTVLDASTYSINGGGGIDFTFNPGTKTCYGQYT